jgi:hypothetical protein
MAPELAESMKWGGEALTSILASVVLLETGGSHSTGFWVHFKKPGTSDVGDNKDYKNVMTDFHGLIMTKHALLKDPTGDITKAFDSSLLYPSLTFTQWNVVNDSPHTTFTGTIDLAKSMVLWYALRSDLSIV